MKFSLDLGKIRLVYMFFVIITILVAITFARHTNVCDMAYPGAVCEQEISTTIGQKIYSIFTFNTIFSDTDFSKKISHITWDYTSLIWQEPVTFFSSLILHYIFVSMVLYGYMRFRKKL